jgi:SAM-dependent methyltransferase
MDLTPYLTLAQLGRRRLRSYADYLRFQRQQARMLSGYLERHNVCLHDRLVLDLGSGLGGYAVEWQAQGGHVVALDLVASSPAIKAARIPIVQANAHLLPFVDGIFDIVFCASLIEHVRRPEWLLSEIRRVLRPGGICYLSFPPFYSLRGGHEFSPFHYLGEKLALVLAQRDRDIPDWLHEHYGIRSSARSFAETYEGWGLYRVTISQARRWVKQAGFTVRHFGTRFLPVNLAAIPILGDVLAWHVQMILESRRSTESSKERQEV